MSSNFFETAKNVKKKQQLSKKQDFTLKITQQKSLFTKNEEAILFCKNQSTQLKREGNFRFCIFYPCCCRCCHGCRFRTRCCRCHSRCFIVLNICCSGLICTLIIISTQWCTIIILTFTINCQTLKRMPQ